MFKTNQLRAISFASVLVASLAFTGCSSEKKPEAQPATTTVAPITISKEMKLVNAVQNLDNLEKEERFETIQALLEDGASPDAENEFGEPVLADAIHFGDDQSYDLRVVQLLIEKGADVNKIGPTGRSALTKAAESGKANVIELLLSHGVELNTENGGVALVKAAFHGHKNVVQLFLNRGFKPSGRYERALLSLSAEESVATAQLFGAYVDIANEELNALLGTNTRAIADQSLLTQLQRINTSCTAINDEAAIRDNMSDYFNRTEECTSTGRLGALAYMHCYGMLKSNSSSMQMLQSNINQTASSARAVMNWSNVKFETISSAAELQGYDKSIRRSIAIYQDVVLPWTRVVGGKMSHHKNRNRQLREQAQKCGNKAILAGAQNISGAVSTMDASHQRQLNGFRQEIAAMEKMRASIIYQLPAVGSAEELKRREEEKRKQEEEKKKQEEEGQKKEEGGEVEPPQA